MLTLRAPAPASFEIKSANLPLLGLLLKTAMHEHKVSEMHFGTSTGYRYDDVGRDNLEKVYAEVFKGEDALVRPQIISGTHALNLALFGNLRPGDELLSPVGKPYDTLEGVIGIRSCRGSLAEYGINI